MSELVSIVFCVQSVASAPSSYFDSVEAVPSTVLALKQALSQQVVVVTVDASSWLSYRGVRPLISSMQKCSAHQYCLHICATLQELYC